MKELINRVLKLAKLYRRFLQKMHLTLFPFYLFGLIILDEFVTRGLWMLGDRLSKESGWLDVVSFFVYLLSLLSGIIILGVIIYTLCCMVEDNEDYKWGRWHRW